VHVPSSSAGREKCTSCGSELMLCTHGTKLPRHAYLIAKTWGWKEGKISPADLGNFFAHANDAFHAVQKGVGVATLGCDINMPES
jgi:hypothetical protein